MTSSNDKVSNIIQIFQTLEQRWRQFRAEMSRNYRYVMTDQIDEEAKKILAKERRPKLVFNLMQDKIIAIAGTIENNHAYMKAVPVREGDEELAQLHTVLVSDWAMKNCNGYREIAKAAVDAAIAKIGWVNNYVSFKNNPEGEWVTESFDPFMVMFDPMSRKKDLSDAKYYIVSAFYTADEILAIYKDIDPKMRKRIKEEDDRISEVDKSGKPKSWAERVGGVTDTVQNWWKERFTEKDTITDWVDARSGIYRVVEFHDRRERDNRVIYNPYSRATKPLRERQEGESDSQFDAAIEMEAQQSGGIVMQTGSPEELWLTVAVPGLLPDDVIYEKKYPVQGAGWQHKAIFCYDFHPDVTKTGSIIDVMVDPQDAFNQRNMTNLEMVMDAVNPSWKVPKGSIAPADLPDWKSKVRGVLKTFQGPSAPEPIVPSGEAISGLKMLSDEALAIADKISGITPNYQGNAEGKSESGRAIAQRVRQTTVMMSYYMGNITFAMNQVFNYCDKNLQKFVTMPRAIRLLDKKNNPKWIQLNVQTIDGVLHDISQGEFDFIVDSNQVGETAKQMARGEIIDLLQVMPPELVPWDKLLKLFDFADVDEWVQYVAQKLGQADAMAQAQQKLKLMQSTAGTMGAMDGVAQAGIQKPAPQEAA